MVESITRLGPGCPCCRQKVVESVPALAQIGQETGRSTVRVAQFNRLIELFREQRIEITRLQQQVAQQPQPIVQGLTVQQMCSYAVLREGRYMEYIDRYFKISKSESVRRKASIYILQEDFEEQYNRYINSFCRQIAEGRRSLPFIITEDIRRFSDMAMDFAESSMDEMWKSAKKEKLRENREAKRREAESQLIDDRRWRNINWNPNSSNA